MKPPTGNQRRAASRLARTAQVREFLSSMGESTNDMEAIRMVLREKCRTDFWFFQCRVYGNADTMTPLHMEFTERYQKRHNKRFSIWLMPRSHLKTSCITEAGTLWELIVDPHERHLIINAKLENAIDILANIRSCVETNEVFRWLFPEYCPDLAPKSLKDRCKWLTHRLDFPCSKYAGKKEGNIEVMSVTASLVSKHYDRMKFDDPVNDDNTTTREYRDKVHRWYKNALQLRHDANSKITIIGTRWHFDDLYSRLIEAEFGRRKRLIQLSEKVVPRYWIYLRQVVEKVESGGETIAGYENVQPIWPERFKKDDIEEIRTENGSYIFSCQYMNNPVPEEDAIFKFSDINPIDEIDIPETVVNFMACDLAVEETEQGDWWVITVASFDHLGRMFVRQVVRDKLLTSSFLTHVAALQQKWKCVKVSVESTAFQKTLNKTYREWCVKNHISVPWVEVDRGRSSKKKRILALQPRVERGDFFIEEHIQNYEYIIDEMVTYPRSTYDDILDTLADLEMLFYGAPEAMKEVGPTDTWQAVYGDVNDDESDNDESFACDFIGNLT